MISTTRGSWGKDRDVSLSEIDMPLAIVPSGVWLILKWPTHFAYSNQTGGHSCQQSWAEGLLVPLKDVAGKTIDSLMALFAEHSKHQGWCANGLDDDDPEQIDAILAEHHHAFKSTRVITVDRERLGDSWEAWVHVRIGEHPQRHPRLPLSLGGPAPLGSAQNAFSWPFFGLPTTEAILTWDNSD